jgi:hypothetical protein
MVMLDRYDGGCTMKTDSPLDASMIEESTVLMNVVILMIPE